MQPCTVMSGGLTRRGPARVALDDAGLLEHAAAISERPSSAARAIIGDRRRRCVGAVVRRLAPTKRSLSAVRVVNWVEVIWGGAPVRVVRSRYRHACADSVVDPTGSMRASGHLRTKFCHARAAVSTREPEIPAGSTKRSPSGNPAVRSGGSCGCRGSPDRLQPFGTLGLRACICRHDRSAESSSSFCCSPWPRWSAGSWPDQEQQRVPSSPPSAAIPGRPYRSRTSARPDRGCVTGRLRPWTPLAAWAAGPRLPFRLGGRVVRIRSGRCARR